MKIFIQKENRWIEKKFSGKANDLLKKLKINPNAIVVIKNDEVITESEVLVDSDEVKLLSVVSGG